MSASTSSAMASATTAAASAVKICFNSHCKEPTKSEPPTRRKGWRLRSGDYADLCDRCSCLYEQGNFCETFHADAPGWRKCEMCVKRLHCGCIVSVLDYVLLDVGGVECVTCARKKLSVAQNQAWPPSLLLGPQPQVPERPKEYPVKSWNQVTGSYPGQWRQASHMWNAVGPQSELQQRLAFEFDRPPNAEKLISVSRPSISTHDRRMPDLPERQAPSTLNHVVRDRYGNGATGDNDPMSARKGVISNTCSTSSSGVNFEMHPNSSGKPSIVKGDSSGLLGLVVPLPSPNGATDLGRVPTTQAQRQMAPPMPKQITPNPQNISDSCVEMRNGRARADARARAQLLPRYWPRITDQELQQISGDSNSVITPLFEKMLSASDAGRIGRLVLPKKCAEAYFPPISQPEGLQLKVQDAGGKEWAFQFRFWPNNNSRMYVLEGVTPCIQSMQLQAGDTVTFSRIDPDGKLVMGFRKASGASTEQENQAVKSANGFPTPLEVNKSTADLTANGPPRPQKGSTESRNPLNAADQSSCDKAGFIQKDPSTAKSPEGPTRRKSNTFGSKRKRLRIENEDSIELKLTWEEAQELLRPPPNDVPNVVLIDGHEFEEYEEAPVLGKPTIFTMNQAGDNNQWAQCEECSKWRKLPVDALLPSRWICSENRWDPERSLCSAAQETSAELTDILPAKTASRRSRVKVEHNENFEVSDGLDTLANLAILGEGGALPASNNQATTRHPRHRPGCTCIVCIQPPSGKGPKHKQTCTCNVCLTVKRRFRTLMLRREKKQSEKDAESAAAIRNKQPNDQSAEMMPPLGSDPLPSTSNSISGSSSPQKTLGYHDGAADDELEKRKTLSSPLKAQIDLNIQPEREEEPSPVADASGGTRAFRDATPTA